MTKPFKPADLKIGSLTITDNEFGTARMQFCNGLDRKTVDIEFELGVGSLPLSITHADFTKDDTSPKERTFPAGDALALAAQNAALIVETIDAFLKTQRDPVMAALQETRPRS